MKFVKLNFLLLLVFSLNIYGQYPTNPTPEDNRRIEQYQRERERTRQAESYARLSDIDARRRARRNPADNPLFPRLLPKPTEKDRQAIAVAEDLSVTYGAFLKQKNTGIVRLHDAANCNEEKYVINADSACPNAYLEKATAFSFRTRGYQSKAYSDIFLEDSKLHLKGFHSLGIFSRLADQSLDDLNLSSDGVKQLIELQPPTKTEDFQKFSKTITKGVQIENHTYNASVQLESGQTYLLRVIAFKDSKKTRDNNKSSVPHFFKKDKRDDITVVFKAVRENDDKSWVLLWKELARKEAPKIDF